MARAVRAAQPRRFNARVDLCTGKMFVAEQLLDRAQVGAAIEQMSGKRVAQRVRVHSPWKLGGASPEPQSASYI